MRYLSTESSDPVAAALENVDLGARAGRRALAGQRRHRLLAHQPRGLRQRPGRRRQPAAPGTQLRRRSTAVRRSTCCAGTRARGATARSGTCTSRAGATPRWPRERNLRQRDYRRRHRAGKPRPHHRPGGALRRLGLHRQLPHRRLCVSTSRGARSRALRAPRGHATTCSCTTIVSGMAIPPAKAGAMPPAAPGRRRFALRRSRSWSARTATSSPRCVGATGMPSRGSSTPGARRFCGSRASTSPATPSPRKSSRTRGWPCSAASTASRSARPCARG